MDKTCLVCNKKFLAKRNTAQFCSASCRVKFSRQVGDDPTLAKLFNGRLTKDEPDIKDSPWYNSKETKTQEEIEAHYTLENFPCPAKYYSVNGGGSGLNSPFPRSDKRSLAYI